MQRIRIRRMNAWDRVDNASEHLMAVLCAYGQRALTGYLHALWIGWENKLACKIYLSVIIIRFVLSIIN